MTVSGEATMSGQVTAVGWPAHGAALLEATIGDVLHVASLVDYDNEGGFLDLNGEFLTYTATWADDADPDGEAGYVQLEEAVTADEGDVATVVEADGSPRRDFIAYVMSDEGDELEIELEYEQRSLWPAGIYDPPVYVELSADLRRIESVPNHTPTIDGGLIDPSTLPDPTQPSEPPATSPLPSVIGNVRSILGSFTPVPLATSYDVLLSTTGVGEPGPDDINTNISGTSQFQISQVQESLATTDPETGETNHDLRPQTDYWVALRARNDLGTAPASAWVGPIQLRQVGNEEISAEFGYFGDITADQIKGGSLEAVIALIGKITTRADENSPGGEIGNDGISGYGVPANPGEAAPRTLFLDFLGGTNKFEGDIEARFFKSYQGSEWYGDANVGKADGGLVMESGVSASSGAPTVDQVVDSVAISSGRVQGPVWNIYFLASRCNGFTWDPTSNSFITYQAQGQGSRMWRVYKNGTVQVVSDIADRTLYGFVRTTTQYANVFRWAEDGNFWLFTSGNDGSRKLQDVGGTPALGLDHDGLVCLADSPGDGTVRIRRFGFDGVLVSSQTTAGVDMGAAVGSFIQGTFDFAGNRMVVTQRGSNKPVRVLSSAGTEQVADGWENPEAVRGVAWDANAASGGGSAFYGLGSDNKLFKFGSNTWGAGTTSRHVVGTTLATATAETQVGQKVTFQAKKRHRIIVTAPQFVAPAIRAGVYIWRGATGIPIDANMARQGYTASGSRVLTLPEPLNYAGPAPRTAPTADPFPISSAFWVRSQGADVNGALIDLLGDGSGRAGPFSWDKNGRTKGAAGLLSSATAASQSIPAGTFTKVQLPDTAFDLGGMQLASSEITVLSAGLYAISYLVPWRISAAGSRRASRIVSSIAGELARAEASGADSAWVAIPGYSEVFLAAGERISLEAFNNVTGGLALNTTSQTRAQLTVRRIG